MRLAILCIILVVGCNSQTLPGIVESVSTYSTCLESPLNQLPLSQGSESNNFTNPCDQYGANEPVTVVTLNLTPNRAGATGLVFTLYHSVNGTTGGTYSSSKNCSGTVNGANCILFNEPIVMTFDTTQLMAAFQLLRRKYPTPNAYNVYVNQQPAAPPGGSSIGSSVAETVSCSLIQKTSNDILIGRNLAGDSGSTSICPQSLTQTSPSGQTTNTTANTFYDPPGSEFVTGTSTTNSACSVLYCRKYENPNDFVSVLGVALEPIGSIFDVIQNPLGIMNVKMNVQTANGTETLVLQSDSGGTLQSIPGLLSAVIDTLDTGIGLIAPYVQGQIIVMNACDNGNSGNTNCDLGLIDDTAGVIEPGDTYTLINPWKSQSGASPTPGLKNYSNCNLPTSLCRQNIGGQPSSARWYFNEIEMNYSFGTGCNQNGMEPSIVVQTNIQQRICSEAAQCPSNNQTLCGILASQCFPGYEQNNAQGLGVQSLTITPCQVAQIWANWVCQYTGTCTGSYDFSSGFFWMPPNFNPEQPNYWIKESRLFTEAIAGDSSEVSIRLSIYTSATFQGEVTTIAPGIFTSAGQTCSSANQANGALVYSVQNTGATAGQYFVSCTAIASTLDQPSSFSFQGVSTTTNGNLTSIQTIQVPAGKIVSGEFDYTYTGTNGQTLQMELILYVQTGSGSLVALEKETVDCTVVGGTTFINNILPNVGVHTVNPPQTKCRWWDLTCWNDLSVGAWLWRLFFLGMGVIIYSTLVFFAFFAIFYMIKQCIEEQKLKNIASSKVKKSE